jgi:hypothetical protein
MKKSMAFIFYRLLFALTDIPIPTDTGDFRLMSRRSLNVLLSMPEQHRFIRGMVSWVGFSQKPVDYERQPRLIGETKYPPSKMIRFALDAITGFSTRPLRFASHIGALVGFLAILLLGNAVIDWMLGYTIQGWTSSIGATLLLGSINLFMLGIIGEYLGRLYIEAKRRPSSSRTLFGLSTKDDGSSFFRLVRYSAVGIINTALGYAVILVHGLRPLTDCCEFVRIYLWSGRQLYHDARWTFDGQARPSQLRSDSWSRSPWPTA